MYIFKPLLLGAIFAVLILGQVTTLAYGCSVGVSCDYHKCLIRYKEADMAPPGNEFEEWLPCTTPINESVHVDGYKKKFMGIPYGSCIPNTTASVPRLCRERFYDKAKRICEDYYQGMLDDGEWTEFRVQDVKF